MLRGVTKKQNLRPIIHKQNNFGGGLNEDLPKSELNRNELSVLENYITYDRYMEGRTGSLETFTLQGSGTIHSAYYHKAADKLVYHRDDKVYVGSSEITDYDAASLGDSGDSSIKPFGKDVLLCTDTSIYLIPLERASQKLFPINSTKPENPFTSTYVASKTTSPFKYRYIYTYSVIVNSTTGALATTGDRFTAGNILIHETPTIDNTGTYAYWAERHRGTAISTSSKHTLDIAYGVGSNIETYHSHISIYRTVDTGINGLDIFLTDDELTTEVPFAWIADVEMDTPTASYDDGTTDVILRARINEGLIFKGALMEALPSSSLAETTEGFLFTATRNAKRLTYSQRSDDTLTGFYNPGFQYHDFDDGIQVLARSTDILSVICNRSSHTCTLTVFENSGELEYVATLTHYVIVDDNIGVIDHGSFARVEQGTFIARCNDNSIRIWDTTGWGRDLAFGRVSDIVKTMTNISRAVSFRGVYLIYYTDDTGDTAPTACLRLALKNEAGEGWCKYTGSSMVIPSDAEVLFRGDDPNGATGVEFLFCIDKTDSKLYWIETFDGPATATINSQSISKYHLDKYDGSSGGTEIIPKFRGADVVGDREHFYKRHRESHIYIRELTRNDGSSTSLSVDASAYVDDSSTATEKLQGIEITGDANFFRNVRGRSIGIEFEANSSAHQVVSTDARYTVEDISHPTKGSFSIDANTWQRDMERSLLIWTLSRPLPLLERVSGTKISSFGLNTITAPDGRSNMYQVGNMASNPFTYSLTTQDVSSWTISFWVKTPDFTNGTIRPILSIAENKFIEFEDATTINASGFSGKTIDSIATGFHHFCIISEPCGNSHVFQNKIYKGTIGGLEAEISGLKLGDNTASNNGTVYMWDVRVMNRLIDADLTLSIGDTEEQAVAYYYDDVIDNSGDKVCPYG